jgi:hypothetical protein
MRMVKHPWTAAFGTSRSLPQTNAQHAKECLCGAVTVKWQGKVGDEMPGAIGTVYVGMHRHEVNSEQ